MFVYFFDDKVQSFIDSQDIATQTKIGRMIGLLEKYGNQIGSLHSKKVGRDLLELRIIGKREVRIFYTFRGEKIFLLHGFVKKSQRIPGKELLVAANKLRMLA